MQVVEEDAGQASVMPGLPGGTLDFPWLPRRRESRQRSDEVGHLLRHFLC
jgi:hypothetical protein